MFHQPYVNQPSIPPAPPPAPVPPQLDLAHIPQQLRRAGIEYDSFLQQLTFNSKDVITGLTQIAGENLPYAEAIVTVVEQRAFHAPAHQKLPFLYLIDSIVKNIGGNYISAFATNLYRTFIGAYAVATVETRMSMHRLLNTWPPIFGLDVVTAMRRSATDHDAQAAQPPAPPQQQAMPLQQQMSHTLRLPQSMQHPPAYDYPTNPRPQQQPPTIQPPPAISQQQQQRMPNIPQAGLQPPIPQPRLAQVQGVPMQPPPHIAASMPLSMPRPQIPQPQAHPMLQNPPRPMAAVPRQPGVMSGVVAQPGVAPAVTGQITRPRITSRPVEPQVPKVSPQFLEVQNTMQGISRKAAMGVHPSSHQVFTMNRLITQQLQSNPLPYQHDALLQYQQQLRDICAKQRHPSPPSQPPYPSSAMPASAPIPSHVPPIAVSAALTGLLRSMRPALPRAPSHTHPQQQVSNQNNPTAPTSEMLRSGPPMPRRSAMGTPVFQTPLPTALKFADLKTMSHASAVRALYTELPHLSKSDGMRFKTKEELREHLDWLFHQNRRKRGKAPNVVVGGSSRGWFEHLDVFLGKQSGSGNGAMKISSSPLVNANSLDSKGLSDQQTSGSNGAKNRTAAVTESKGENELCAACNEAFESFWDDDRHAWMLRGAERTDDGEIFHSRCVEMIEADEKQKQISGTEYADADANADAEPQSEQSPYLVPSAAKTEPVPANATNVPTVPQIVTIPKVDTAERQKVEAKIEATEEAIVSPSKDAETTFTNEATKVAQPGSGQKRKREEIEETTIDEGNSSAETKVNLSVETALDLKTSQITDAEDDGKDTLGTIKEKPEERPGKKAKIEEEVLDGNDGTSVAPS